MSDHLALVRWTRDGSDFAYDAYSRDHTWAFDSGIEVAASSSPTYLGSDHAVDPEEAFVASLASCHMLTFLAIASRKRLLVDAYVDRAVGVLTRNPDGRLAITEVTLSPRVTWHGAAPEPEVLERMHHLAHEECFIANSVTTEVTVITH